MSERKRSANWLIQEKMLLLDLVTDHYSIIKNKKTDGVSVKQKNTEWVKMSDKFNSQTTGVHRTAENLKAQWESLKKYTKKAASSARQSFLQTGGGPAKPPINDPIQNRIMGLLSTSAVGLRNKFQIKEASVCPKPNEEDIGNTPRVKTPKLKARSCISKRRPTYPETCSSVIEEFQKKKIKALEMQMNFAEIEREEQKKLFEIKYETQKEILKQEKLKTRLLRIQIINAREKKENN